MRLLLLGAGGFIGSHLVETLVETGRHEVVGFDVSADKIPAAEAPGFEFFEGDVRTDLKLVEHLVRDTDVVVDLISYANPSLYVSQPRDVFDLNFRANLSVATLCVDHGTRLIQFSTSEVYGAPMGDVYKEDESPLVMGPVTKQRWIYASAKQLLERVLHAYGLEGTLDYTIVRPFNVLGSRLDYLVPAGSTGGPRVFSHFMSALLTGGPLYLVNGGTAKRTFTHVEDAKSAFVAMLESSQASRQIYNLGNPGNETTIRGMAELMIELYEELTGTRPGNELVEVGGDEFYGPGYADTSRVPPDVSKLRSLGWEPRFNLRATVGDAMQYYLDPAHQQFVS